MNHKYPDSIIKISELTKPVLLLYYYSYAFNMLQQTMVDFFTSFLFKHSLIYHSDQGMTCQAPCTGDRYYSFILPRKHRTRGLINA